MKFTIGLLIKIHSVLYSIIYYIVCQKSHYNATCFNIIIFSFEQVCTTLNM